MLTVTTNGCGASQGQSEPSALPFCTVQSSSTVASMPATIPPVTRSGMPPSSPISGRSKPLSSAIAGGASGGAAVGEVRTNLTSARRARGAAGEVGRRRNHVRPYDERHHRRQVGSLADAPRRRDSHHRDRACVCEQRKNRRPISVPGPLPPACRRSSRTYPSQSNGRAGPLSHRCRGFSAIAAVSPRRSEEAFGASPGFSVAEQARTRVYKPGSAAASRAALAVR